MSKYILFSLLLISACADVDRKVNVVAPGYVGIPCPDWSKTNGFGNFNNTNHSNYGCATIKNAGVMVEDKRDLIRGKTGVSEGARAATVVTRYKSGQPISVGGAE